MDHRIIVLGASGSGASTTGRALSEALEIPYFDGDDYYHGPSDPPFQNPRSPDERYAMIMSDLEMRSSWVLGGGVVGWDPYPDLDFTLAIFLWVPLEERMRRLKTRERERFGSRLDLGGDMYETHQEFMDWASRYDEGGIEGKTMERHEEWMMDQDCLKFDFRGVTTVDDLVKSFLASIPT